MPDSWPAWPESRDYYRERAGQMLKRAQNAQTPEMRVELLSLADHWERRAQTSEHPNR